MGTRNASMRTEFNGEKPVFTQDPDVINVSNVLAQGGMSRESTLTTSGAVFARGSQQSPFGFTLVRDYEPLGIVAPAGDGKHPGPRDMAALIRARDDVLEVWYPFIQSEDAFQEQLGSVNMSNTVRSGVTKVMNADWGYAAVEQPGRNVASVVIYKIGGKLSKVQAKQAYDQGLFQKEVADKLGLDTLSDAEREAARQQAADQASRDAEDRRRATADKVKLVKAEIDELKATQQLRDLEAQRDALKSGTSIPTTGGGTTTTGGGTTAAFRTIEIYGISSAGAMVPLMQVVTQSSSGWTLIPGNQVFSSDSPNDGFHLAGTPGAWNQNYAGHSPTEWGLDANTAVMFWDPNQHRGFVVPASVLQTVFGANWRATIYP